MTSTPRSRRRAAQPPRQRRQLALKRAHAVRGDLEGRGWPAPLLCDSGNGYHLLYRIDLPSEDGGLLRRVLRTLAGRFDDQDVEIDTSVFNPARLTRVYGTWSRKGVSTPDRPHRPTAILETSHPLLPVERHSLEALAGEEELEEGTAQPAAATGTLAVNPDSMPEAEKVARAEAYLARLKPAVEGKKGDRQTYRAAMILIKDFAIDVEQAWPLLQAYNARCQPPWNEADLRRKLDMAAAVPGQRGSKLGRSDKGRLDTGSSDPEQSRGEQFLIPVPDFVQWDANWKVSPPPQKKTDSKGRACRQQMLNPEWVLDLVRFALVAQRCNWVILSDVFLAQLVWGVQENRPPNWREQLGRSLQSAGLGVRPVKLPNSTTKDDDGKKWVNTASKEESCKAFPRCPRRCSLHGKAGVQHRHFHILLDPEELGVLREFTSTVEVQNCFMFEFRNSLTEEEAIKLKSELEMESQHLQTSLRLRQEWMSVSEVDQIKEMQEKLAAKRKRTRAGARRVNGVWTVYLPVHIFGPSPLVGLTPTQCRLLQALTVELTRSSMNKARPDKAQVVPAGSSLKYPNEHPVPVCPFLKEGNWVGFNGTGRAKRPRLHGYGFRLAIWMQKAAYPDEGDYRTLLCDLASLTDPYGLVAAGWDHSTGRWYTLQELQGLCRWAKGQGILKKLVLRVYTRADYLTRWRRHFADRLGLAGIPGGMDCSQPADDQVAGAAVSIRTPEQLQHWMTREELTDNDLGKHLGVARETICRYRNGQRRWRSDFQVKLDAYLAAKRHNSSLPASKV